MPHARARRAADPAQRLYRLVHAPPGIELSLGERPTICDRLCGCRPDEARVLADCSTDESAYCMLINGISPADLLRIRNWLGKPPRVNWVI
jgi:hypothetical protein